MRALCLDILNSEWHDWRGSGKHEDRLARPGWVEQLLAQWSLPLVDAPSEAMIEELRSLRTFMQCIVQALHQGQDLSQEDMARLNAYLDALTMKWQLTREGDQYQIQQQPLVSDWNEVLGEVVRSFATLLTHDPSRIKQCENPDCRWFYYDESANESRRWCDEPCANLMRVRRFRQRHRNA